MRLSRFRLPVTVAGIAEVLFPSSVDETNDGVAENTADAALTLAPASQNVRHQEIVKMTQLPTYAQNAITL